MRKFLLFSLLLLLSAVGLQAQVTTSSINGSVKDAKGEALIGATVKAIHQPSGSTYGASTNSDGRFAIPSMRIGGPYQIEVTYIGYSSKKYSDVSLKLGEAFILNVVLDNSGTQLQEVVVSGTRDINAQRTGASTNIGSRQLATLPTITRSITDYTRLTPQASGNSFGGRDNRYNNIQVDGANLNNSFGTSTDPLPGGGAQPISIDAYDEISINIAPFDVRQSGFTGAGINAVTKSGTNTFKGTAYTFYRDQSFNGKYLGDVDLSKSIVKQKSQIYGTSIGGPIIKNKVFFFVNFEYEKGQKPGISYSPTGGSGLGNVSTTPIDSLKKFSDLLASKYGYQTGAYDNFPGFNSENYKVVAKLDWNINDEHRLTAKFSNLRATEDVALNSTSLPNGGNFSVVGGTNTISRLPNGRFSERSLSFANSNLGFINKVPTATLELNSNFHSKMSNQLLATFSKNRATRTHPGQLFPAIEIFNGAGQNYMFAGTDPYTFNNDVISDSYSIVDNFTYYAGKHTLTAGGTYEYQKVGNMFMPGSQGYYVYNTLNDFTTGAAPAYYAYTYSLVPGKTAVYSAELKIGQLGFYAQDEYNPSSNLKFTFGLRADKPIYHENPIENPQITALQFPDKNGNLMSYNTGKWPKSRFLISPRVGFRWNASANNTLVVRGGAGMFTGRIPFVFLTNQPTNSGMYQFGGAIRDAATLAKVKFSTDPLTNAALFPSSAGTTVPSGVVVIDPNFKFPQIFRTNLAFEKSLGNGFNLNVEALYSKDINAVRMRNANLKAPNGTIVEGDNTRVRYVSTANTDRFIYPNIATAIVLENTNKGYASSLTGQVSKSFSNGFFGSLAYTYTVSKEVSANPGSTASSVWSTNPNVGTSNDVELGNSQYASPNRVVGSASYKFSYAKHFASTFSLFYQGSQNGDPYSYVINGDLNGDGNNAADLMYIPKNSNEILFTEFSSTFNGQTITFTPQMQAAALEQFINNSPYLRKHRGEYAERNAALRPWFNRIDVRFLQDFFMEAGGRKHTLQFSADVTNLPNLLNKYWGIQQGYTINNPLTYKSIDATTGKVVYNMAQANGKLVTNPFQNTISTSNTWSVQLGLRYIF